MNVKYAARPPSEVSAPRYASPSVTDSPICVVSSTLVSLGFLDWWIGSFRELRIVLRSRKSQRFPPAWRAAELPGPSYSGRTGRNGSRHRARLSDLPPATPRRTFPFTPPPRVLPPP